jgi:hypothetical protein
MRVLRRVPHRQPVVLGVVGGHHTTSFQGHRGQALHLVLLPHHMGGLRTSRGEISSPTRHFQDAIGLQLRVHDRRVGMQRLQRIDHRRQRGIVHLHELQGIPGHGGGLGDHDGDRLPHVADLVPGEHRRRCPRKRPKMRSMSPHLQEPERLSNQGVGLGEKRLRHPLAFTDAVKQDRRCAHVRLIPWGGQFGLGLSRSAP